jgi:hypothetical protein
VARNVTPLQLGVAFDRFSELWDEKMLRNFPNHVIARLERRVPALTPRLTGRLAGGWKRIAGVRGMFKLQNPVEYAGVVLPGRRRSKRGRTVGSTQQPDDVVIKALGQLDSEVDAAIESNFRDLDAQA